MKSSAQGSLRFLYVHPVNLPGVEANGVQAAETCRALAELGHEVFLIVKKLEDGAPAAVLARLGLAPHPGLFLVEEPAIRLKNTSGLRSVLVRGLLLWFLSALKRRGRTVLYFRTLKDSRLARFLLTASRLLRAPVIYEAHKIYAEKRVDQGFQEETLRRIRRLEARVFERAHGVVASHPLLEAELRKELRPAGRTMVAPNGVRAVEAPPGEKEFDAVYAGSLFPWKGVDVCLEAVARAPGRSLAVVGGNPAERLAELQERAAALGILERVRFLGQRPRQETLEIVARARAALVPLDPEFAEGDRYTFPLKLLEAMMLGVPVVAADSPAIRTFVTEGRDALLFPRGDAAALAAALFRVLEEPGLSARLEESGRRLAAEHTFAGRAARVAALARALL